MGKWGLFAGCLQRTACKGECEAQTRNALPRAEHKRGLRICGRADGDRNSKGCGAVKSKTLFSNAKPQFLGYLAMMRYQQLVFEIVNCISRAFTRTEPTPDGQVQESRWYNTLSQTGLTKIFDLVCHQLATSILSTKRLPFPLLSTSVLFCFETGWLVLGPIRIATYNA